MKDNAVREISKDEIAKRITVALGARDMSHDEAIALGDDPHETAMVLELLQATGAIEAYCGPIQPSSCMYRLAGKGEETR